MVLFVITFNWILFPFDKNYTADTCDLNIYQDFKGMLSNWQFLILLQTVILVTEVVILFTKKPLP